MGNLSPLNADIAIQWYLDKDKCPQIFSLWGQNFEQYINYRVFHAFVGCARWTAYIITIIDDRYPPSLELYLVYFQEAMKRKAVGIWNCQRCKKTVAGGAWVYRYLPFIAEYLLTHLSKLVADNFLNFWNYFSEKIRLHFMYAVNSHEISSRIFAGKWKCCLLQ